MSMRDRFWGYYMHSWRLLVLDVFAVISMGILISMLYVGLLWRG